MGEQRTAHALVHGVGQDPQVLQPCSLAFAAKGIESHGAPIGDCGTSFVGDNEFWSDRKRVTPNLKPAFRVTPMPFCGKGNGAESGSVLGLGPDNIDGAVK